MIPPPPRGTRRARDRALVGWPETTRRHRLKAGPHPLVVAGRRAIAGRGAEILCLGLLLLMAVNFLTVLPRKTITTDEIVHIPAGYTNLVSGNFRPNNEHPPLVKLWSALPLLVIGANEPPGVQAETPGARTAYYGRQFWEANSARFETLTFWARAPMIVLTLALGGLIFGYTRRLFGPRAAVLAVALFSVEPTVLAHGRVVQTDIAATLAYLSCFVALHAYAAVPGLRRAMLLGLTGGAALVTKFSMLALVPVLAVAALGLWAIAPRRGLRRRQIVAHTGVVAIVALFVINAAYFFRNQPLEAADLRWIAVMAPARDRDVLAGVQRLSNVVPTYYLIGASTIFFHNAGGHGAGLLGTYSARGWWYYFPVAFALKTTLPFLLLTLGALGWALWRLVARREVRLLALLGPFALYTALSMSSRINIGIRHLLPAFPFLFILGGAALDRLLRLRHTGGRVPGAVGEVVVVLALCWMAIEAARAYPHYLAYMNGLTWQHPRWYYLSDSNIEWGEDVPELARYLHAHGETSVRGAVAGAWSTLKYYDIEFLDALAPPAAQVPETRYIAIGASFLNGSTVRGAGGDGDRPLEQQRRNFFAEYRARAPEAVFGQSIYLYRAKTKAPPASAPLPGNAFRAGITALNPPPTLRAGQVANVRVRIRNVSDVTWPKLGYRGPSDGLYQVRLGNHWLDGNGREVATDDGRTALPYDLDPGDEAELQLPITAPLEAGEYVLEIDLLQEGVTWFGRQGSPTARVRVRVAR